LSPNLTPKVWLAPARKRGIISLKNRGAEMDGFGAVMQIILLGAVWGHLVLALLVFGFMASALATQAVIGLITLLRKHPRSARA